MRIDESISGAAWCSAARRGAARCGVARRGAVWRGVAWRVSDTTRRCVQRTTSALTDCGETQTPKLELFVAVDEINQLVVVLLVDEQQNHEESYRLRDRIELEQENQPVLPRAQPVSYTHLTLPTILLV